MKTHSLTQPTRLPFRGDVFRRRRRDADEFLKNVNSHLIWVGWVVGRYIILTKIHSLSLSHTHTQNQILHTSVPVRLCCGAV